MNIPSELDHGSILILNDSDFAENNAGNLNHFNGDKKIINQARIIIWNNIVIKNNYGSKRLLEAK